MAENKKETFLKGAAILGIAGIVVKVLGAAFRIPLVWIITSEGLGYYQTAYPIYVMLVGIATSGFPVAISKMVSDRRVLGNYKGADKVFSVVFKVLVAFGIISFLGVALGAKYIVTERLHNPKAFLPMLALAPALLIVPVMAAFRGYFQGHNDMRPSAISQIVEQFSRVVVGLGLAWLLVPRGLEYGAAGGTFGATAGALGGLAVIFYLYKKKSKIHDDKNSSDKFEVETSSKIIKEMLNIALPIIIGALVMPVMGMIDLALVMDRLNAVGFSIEQANEMYGQLTGIAATLVNLPQVVTSAVAISLVPVISSAFTMKDMEKLKTNSTFGLRVSLLIGLPAGVGLFVLSTPIINMLFPREPSSIGQILAITSVGVVFLSIIQSTTSILQGMGNARIPVVNLFIGAAVKFVLTYTLTGIPFLNVKGAAISTVSAYIVAAVLDYIAVRRRVDFKIDFKKMILAPLVSVALMGALARGTYEVLYMISSGNSISVLGAIAVGGMVYLVAIVKTNAITKDELMSIRRTKTA